MFNFKESDDKQSKDLDPPNNEIDELNETDKISCKFDGTDDVDSQETEKSLTSKITVCTECNSSLSGKKYLMRDEDPCCVECYEKLYSNTCEACKEVIGTEFKVSCIFPSFFVKNSCKLTVYKMCTVFIISF